MYRIHVGDRGSQRPERRFQEATEARKCEAESYSLQGVPESSLPKCVKVKPKLRWWPQGYWSCQDPKRSAEKSCSHRVQLARENTIPTAGSRTGEARISKSRVWYFLCLVQYQSSLIVYSSFCPSLLWMGSQLAALRRDLGLLSSVETVRLWVLLKLD